MVPRYRTFKQPVATSCAAGVAVTGCVAGAGAAAATTNKRAGADDVATYPMKLPGGYSSPTGLATVPGGTDVWAVTSSLRDDGTTLFRFNPKTAVLSHYPISCPSDANVNLGLASQLAVEPGGGTVWLGVDQTLVRLQVSTRHVTCIAIPEAFLPTGLLALPPEVTAAASPGGGLVAVANASNDVDIYHVATSTWSELALPSGYSPSANPGDMAYLADGRLLVTAEAPVKDGMTLFMTEGSGVVDVGSAGFPSAVVTDGNRFATTGAAIGSGSVLDGVATEKLVTHDGDPVLVTSPSTDLGGRAGALLGDGELAVPSASGIEVIDVSDGDTRELSFGTEAGGPATVVSPGVTVPNPTRVPLTAQAMVSDSSGNLWFVPDNNTPEIGEVKASKLAG